MTITDENQEETFQFLKKFYRDEIRKAGLYYGYRELSSRLGHSENFITVCLRRDAFGALRRLYIEIKGVER